MSNWDLPERGVAFWPVGNGDSVTIAVDTDIVIQIDLNDVIDASEDDDPRVPVIDRLVDVLPRTPAGMPRLAVLGITHHDSDHCRGFERLPGRIQVDELWVTLRCFVEAAAADELSEEGQAVYDEARRRRQAEVAAAANGKRANPGDRLRIIGYHDVIEDPEWEAFPDELLTVPGNFITTINGDNLSDRVELFVHTPFKEDTEDGSRNSTSLGLHVTLLDGDKRVRLLLLGDLEHQQIEAFFDRSAENNGDRLEWDLLLAPHHGSHHAIRQLEAGTWVDAEAFENLSEWAADDADVVVSCRSLEEIAGDDTNPPHEDAIDAYERMVGADHVFKTCNHAEGTDSDPVTFSLDGGNWSEVVGNVAAAAALLGAAYLTGRKIRRGDRSTGSGSHEFA